MFAPLPSSRRRRRTKNRQRRTALKRPWFEPLEDRRLLAVTIDTFETRQVVEDPPGEPPTGSMDVSSSLDVPTTEAIGGQRDLEVMRTSNPVVGNALLSVSVGQQGFLELNVSAATTGFGLVTWDGKDDDPTNVDTNGLNNFDLTQGGANTQLQFTTLKGDQPGGKLTITVWTVDGNSVASTEVDIPTPQGQNVTVPFSAFAGADFTQLGAIQIELTGPQSIDTSISEIVANGPPAIDIEKLTNMQDADTPKGPIIPFGDTAMFTYVVTNPGGVPLSNVTVVDDNGTPLIPGDDFSPMFVGGDANMNMLLDPGEMWQYSAQRTVTPGQYTNDAKVTGEDGTGTMVMDNDPSNHFGSDPDIDIEKATNGDDADTPTGPIVTVGDTVIFTYEVSNTGNVPLENVTVTDDNGTPAIPGDNFNPTFTGGDTNNDDVLDLDEVWTYTAQTTATLGQYTNLADVTGDEPDTGEMVVDDDPSNHFGSIPDIDIEKATNGEDADTPTGPIVNLGDTVIFTYEVTNTGNVPLSNVVVTDDNGTPLLPGDDFSPTFTGGDTNGNNMLDLTETWTYTAQRTAAPVGQYTNIADVTGLDAGTGQTVTDDDPSNHRVIGELGIDIEKATNGEDADTPTGPIVSAGDTVIFTYVVTNTGNVPLSNVVVTDDNGTPGVPGDDFDPTFVGGDTNNNNMLDVTETWTYTAQTTATVGQYTNIAKVTGEDGSGTMVMDDDPSNHLVPPPEIGIDIEKATNGQDADTPTGPVVNAGDTVIFTYEVINTGNVPLSNVVVTDDNGTPGVPGDDFDPTFVGGDTNNNNMLDVTETWTYTAQTTATVGQYTNIAKVTGEDGSGTMVMDDDPSNHFVPPDGDLEIHLEKLTNGQDADTPTGPIVNVGDNVMFTYVVTTPGTVPLQIAQIIDDNGTPLNPGDDFSPIFMGGDANMNGLLDPGEMWQYFAMRVATPGQYTNEAKVTGVDPNNIQNMAMDTDPSNHFGDGGPMIDIEKATNGQDADTPTGPIVNVGDTVIFTYEVSNTGNVPLSNVVVTDDNGTPLLPGDDFNPTFIGGDTNNNNMLDLTETWTYTAQTTATVGQYTNIAKVTGEDGSGTMVMNDDPSNHLVPAPDLEIDIEKLTNGQDADTPTGPEIPEGGTATFTYQVTNPGEVALTVSQITDDNGTPAIPGDDFSPVFVGGDTNLNGLLDLTETWLYTAQRTVTLGQYTNNAKVTGTDPDTLQMVMDSDPSNHRGVDVDDPRIHIEKLTNGEDADTPTGPMIPVGGTATFAYAVNNTGNVSLSNVAVTDDNGTPLIPGDDFSPTFVGGDTNMNNLLDLTETWTYTAQRTVTEGQYTNVSKVTGQGPQTGQMVMDDDPSNHLGVVDQQNPDIKLIKIANHAPDGTTVIIDYPQVVWYQYTVINTGDTFLTDIEVIDDAGTPANPADDILIGVVPGPLAPGANVMLGGDFFVGQDTVNKATATGEPSDPNGTPLNLPPVMDMDDARVVIHNKISGKVFVDYDNDGYLDWGEQPIPHVQIRLDRLDAPMDPRFTTTDYWGGYWFDWLEPGLYKVTQNQPHSYKDGKNTPGYPGADNPDFQIIEYEAGVVDDMFSGIEVANGVHAQHYNFAELLYRKHDFTAGSKYGSHYSSSAVTEYYSAYNNSYVPQDESTSQPQSSSSVYGTDTSSSQPGSNTTYDTGGYSSSDDGSPLSDDISQYASSRLSRISSGGS